MSTNLSSLPPLAEGNRSPFIKLLQRFLVLYGYFKTQAQKGLEPIDGKPMTEAGVDGVFGANTETAVKIF